MLTVSTAILRDLHRLHSQLADLRGRLERGPKQVIAHQANVTKLNTALDTAHEQVKQARLAADRKQLDIQQSEAKIANWEVQLNGSSSNKEYQALQEQIAAGRMAASVLEDETLELLTRIDDLVTKVGEAEEQLVAGKAELNKVQTRVESTAETLRQEVKRLETDLETAEAELHGEFKNNYLRVIRNKGADGLAPAEDGVCQGCGNQMTLNMQSELTLSQPVFCKACGCLLYLPE